MLANDAAQIASIDFFAVPTGTFRVLFVVVVLSHDRRRIVQIPEVGGLHHYCERRAA